MKSYELWTQKEIDILKTQYQLKSYKELGLILNKSKGSIESKRKRLGLPKKQQRSTNITLLDKKLTTKFHQCKFSAKIRNIPFKIPKGFYKTLVVLDCFYCGDPSNINGLDRINNDLGYIIGNCVPCCSTCNLMKRTLGWRTFIDHVSKIVEVDKKRNFETSQHD